MAVQLPHDHHGYPLLLFRRPTLLDCRWINFAMIILRRHLICYWAASHICVVVFHSDPTRRIGLSLLPLICLSPFSSHTLTPTHPVYPHRTYRLSSFVYVQNKAVCHDGPRATPVSTQGLQVQHRLTSFFPSYCNPHLWPLLRCG